MATTAERGEMSDNPRLLFLAGPDGSGKSTLARIAVEELASQGKRVKLIWSRYNNITSKPLLGLARLTGHSYYEAHESVRFGYHDFDRLPIYCSLFTLTQMIDVNLAAFHCKSHAKYQYDVLLFDRGPWDTLADVILDTGRLDLAKSRAGRVMIFQVRHGTVLLVRRDKERILQTRPELLHDRKLGRKIAIYEHLADAYGWCHLDNNRPLETVAADLRMQLKGDGRLNG